MVIFCYYMLVSQVNILNIFVKYKAIFSSVIHGLLSEFFREFWYAVDNNYTYTHETKMYDTSDLHRLICTVYKPTPPVTFNTCWLLLT